MVPGVREDVHFAGRGLRRYFRFLLWKQELQPKLLFVGGIHLLGEIPLDKCPPVSSRLQPVEEPTPLPAPLGVINHPFAVNQTH